jgi:hypothetical protein
LSCTQVWKTRNLTFKGKTLIVKNFLLAQMGFETEMRGIPEKYKKEVNDLIWKFLWDNKPNQIERNVCCLNIKEGGMGMINIDNFVKSKQIKCICKIINSEIDSWNAIDKQWLKKYDNTFGVAFFFFYLFLSIMIFSSFRFHLILFSLQNLLVLICFCRF